MISRLLRSNVGLTVVFGVAWAFAVAGGFALYASFAPAREPESRSAEPPPPGTGSAHAETMIERAKPDLVRLPLAGKIEFAGRVDGFEGMVIADHGGGLQTVYAHLGETLAREGQSLSAGEVVGRAGPLPSGKGFAVGFEAIREGQPVPPKEILNGRTLGAALFRGS